MARVLHISDLHVDKRSLNEIWQPVASKLGRQKFDFVVVSGDLAKIASTDEYESLDKFARTKLLSVLEHEHVARVVFVPGNHDVQWDDAHFERTTFDAQAPSDLPRVIEQARFEPHRSKHRLHVTKFGHVELLRIRDEPHRRRMANLQAFLSEFYKNSLEGDSQPFSLGEPQRDFSCHVFPGEGVAFVGLNSCHGNDKYWHGAGFDPETLEAVRARVDSLLTTYPHLLVVAVWHHGFASSAARPDRLSLDDLGAVFNIGVHLGLHGHTHSADGQHHELVSGKLPVIATGSLAAGRDQRPDGTPNQFCILKVRRTRVDAVVHRLDLHGAYVVARQLRFRIDHDRRSDTREQPACRLHRRTCEVNTDGICRVSIELEGLHGVGAVPLTLITRSYCGVNHDRQASCDNENVDVLEKQITDRNLRFVLPVNRDIQHVTWSYFISNAVAINKGELELLPSRTDHPHLRTGEDAYSHTVRFECERLELSMLMEDKEACPEDVRVLVERRSGDEADRPWEPDDGETARVQSHLTPRGDGRGHVLAVDAPIVGRRYSLLFRPRGDVLSYPAKAAELSRTVLEDCRLSTFEKGALRADLTAAVDNAIAEVLGETIGEWVGHLWHAEERALLAGFGSFSCEAWSSYFEAGTGVAGHAFRHSSIVGWDRNRQPGRAQTIFRRRLARPGQSSPEYQWVLCIPLRLERNGPSIGVVGFARRAGAKSRAEVACERFVANLGTEQPDGTLVKLESGINVAFWTTLEKSAVPSDLRSYAESRRKAIIG